MDTGLKISQRSIDRPLQLRLEILFCGKMIYQWQPQILL